MASSFSAFVYNTLKAPAIDGVTGVVDLNTGTTIASAATINLNAATGNRVHITGTTAITAVTLTRGPRTVIFDGILTLTHNATTNNLPGAANITTAAGDRAIYESDGTTVYCVSYVKVSGAAIASGGGITTIASGSFPAAATLDITSIPATYAYLILQITGVSCTAAARTLVQVSTNNGSSFDTTAANYGDVWISTATVSNPSAATMVYANSQQNSGDFNNITLRISGYQGGVYAEYRSRIMETTGVNEVFGHYSGSTSAINALRVLWDAAGNFDAGTYALYGVS